MLSHLCIYIIFTAFTFGIISGLVSVYMNLKVQSDKKKILDKNVEAMKFFMENYKESRKLVGYFAQIKQEYREKEEVENQDEVEFKTLILEINEKYPDFLEKIK